jgi:anti-sigma-K factor RskA
MTSVGFSAPECRDIRQLLGVYVVGAIDPAERATVDDHLAGCQACRDELASLAGLPALLSRVPLEDVERIIMAPDELPAPAEPSPELLGSLLRRTSTRRRNRMWRVAASVAAAAVIAVGGTAAVMQLTGQHPATEVARGTNGPVSVVVDYSATSWGGTAMRVKVSGIPPGTTCEFFARGSAQTKQAGSWVVENYGTHPTWYSASAQIPVSSVRSFYVTSLQTGKTLVSIPVH